MFAGFTAAALAAAFIACSGAATNSLDNPPDVSGDAQATGTKDAGKSGKDARADSHPPPSGDDAMAADDATTPPGDDAAPPEDGSGAIPDAGIGPCPPCALNQICCTHKTSFQYGTCTPALFPCL